MSQRMIVTVPGSDTFTETDPNNFALRSDDNTVLIKEKARGSVSPSYNTTQQIAHGLAYIPMCLVWGDDENGNLIYGCMTNAISLTNEWIVSIDASNLNILQGVDSNPRVASYYIFYDLVS